MKNKVIVCIFLLISALAMNAQEKEKVVGYHFEYGFGLMDIHSFPKRFERDENLPFPILDEYVVGYKFPTKTGYVLPNIGVFEKSYDITYGKDRIVKSTYGFSGGCIVRHKQFDFKISNRGFSVGLRF